MIVTDWLTVAADADAGGGDCCSGTSWFRDLVLVCLGYPAPVRTLWIRKAKEERERKSVQQPQPEIELKKRRKRTSLSS